MNELALFAGAGGGIIGGMLCGWRTVCAVEIEDYPRRVLLQRQADGILPRFPIWDDVRTFDGKPWRGKIDIITGGFPCQDISAAGKGKGIAGERSGLWKEMSRIIREVRPRYALIENSPMLVVRGLDVVLCDLAEMGYDAEWGVIGANDVGAPHKRDRTWILGYSNDYGYTSSEVRKSIGARIYSDKARKVETIEFAGSDIKHSPMAYTGCKRSETWNTTGMEADTKIRPYSTIHNQSSCSGSNVSNSTMPYGERMRCTNGSNAKRAVIDTHCAWWRQDPAEQTESGLGRMAHGVANWVDRLKAIGNGQVPAVVRIAWGELNGRI